MTNHEELKSSTGKTFLKIQHNPGESWIYANWIGYPIPENVAKGAIANLDAMKAHNLNCIINDNRNLVGRWDESLNWIEQTWLPYATTSGLRYLAHIAADDALSAGAAAVMRDLIKPQIQMQVFNNLEDAREWLCSLNN